MARYAIEVPPGDETQERPNTTNLENAIDQSSTFCRWCRERDRHRGERLRIRKNRRDVIAVAATMSRHVSCAWEPISAGQEFGGFENRSAYVVQRSS